MGINKKSPFHNDTKINFIHSMFKMSSSWVCLISLYAM